MRPGSLSFLGWEVKEGSDGGAGEVGTALSVACMHIHTHTAG